MKRFIEGGNRSQATLPPEHLDDYIAEDNPVRVVDAFVDELTSAGILRAVLCLGAIARQERRSLGQ